MKKSEDIIKNSLRKDMQRINDDSFTDRIIEMHLSQERHVGYRPFLNFASLIIGISSVLISIGLILLVRVNNQLLINSIDFSEQHGLILLSLSFIFLIYRWIEEFTAPKSVTTIHRPSTDFNAL
jgi:hypothetical protein